MRLEILIDWQKPVVTLNGGTPYKLVRDLGEKVQCRYEICVAKSKAVGSAHKRYVDRYGYDQGGTLLVKNQGVDLRKERSKLAANKPKTKKKAVSVLALVRRIEQLESKVDSVHNAFGKALAKLAQAENKIHMLESNAIPPMVDSDAHGGWQDNRDDPNC